MPAAGRLAAPQPAAPAPRPTGTPLAARQAAPPRTVAAPRPTGTTWAARPAAGVTDMPVFDVDRFQLMADCWDPRLLKQSLALLQGTEAQDAMDWINRYIFDESLKRRDRVNVTKAIREHIPG